MAEKNILIRQACPKDLEDIFRLYNNYMFDSYLKRFGGLFVRRYLKIILGSRYCISLVAAENQTVGFITATFDSRKLLSELFLDAGMFRLWLERAILHLGLVFKSLELVFYPLNTRLKDVNAELLFIAIEPAYRKRNLAISLISEVLASMKKKGVKKVKVSTHIKNAPVNALLGKIGFRVEKTFRLFKKPMCLYGYRLD
ncbi:MAG: hypothetical protein A2Z72_04725 [Omnitrophica bacterium RBG_13_46_9]|nr:MAG: hypothetical protein A2Z72_04725 [Omnitrophica bacterium RBG_13_46_9]